MVIFALMVAMLVLDRGRIDRRSRQLRGLRVGIALVLAASTTYAPLALANALVVGSAAIVNSPAELLRTGGLVWVGLLITFTFVYWELDIGGPAERANLAERRFPVIGLTLDCRIGDCPRGEHLPLT